MSRRILAALTLAASLLCFAGAAADLPEKWRSWRYSRRITGPAVESLTHAELKLPWEIFSHCTASCADLRLVNSRGEEVPYEMMQGRQRSTEQIRHLSILENSFIAGKFTQVVGKLPDQVPLSFDRLTVQTTLADFLVSAEVALSDDAKVWRIVEPKAPIARFRSRAIEGTQSIPIEGLSSLYVRIRVFSTEEKFPVDGLTVASDMGVKRETETVPVTFASGASGDPEIVTWKTTLASANQPISELRLQTESQEFYRVVRVMGSSDNQEWNYIASGIVYRYLAGEKKRESLVLEFPGMSGFRFIRVEMVNGNDQPLGAVGLTLAAVPWTILLRYAPAEQDRLLYGNERAKQPQYDLAHYFDFGPVSKPAYLILSVGSEEITGNYRDPRPFTEQHPEVLWLALGAAIVLIGLTAIKTLRTPAKPAGQT